tara:strand:- start:317 stop:613 length:297 start_codon:yes stop_codon:yes gene_type:complete
MAITNRSITSTEALNFMKKVLQDIDYLKVNWGNFRKTPKTLDTYQVTVDKLSDKAIGRLIESDEVSDVYYCASMPPSGAGYGIDLRYRLYVIFNKVKL